eukprot:scaffold92650_cov21-Prasinocladus_malaysianus.AAC.1
MLLWLLRIVFGLQICDWNSMQHHNGSQSVRAKCVLLEVDDVSRFLITVESLLSMKKDKKLDHRLNGSLVLTVGGDAAFVGAPILFELNCQGGSQDQTRTSLVVRYNMCLLANCLPEIAELQWAPDYEWSPERWLAKPIYSDNMVSILEYKLCDHIMALGEKQEASQGNNQELGNEHALMPRDLSTRRIANRGRTVQQGRRITQLH